MGARRSEGGFTLLEMMVALAVFSIAALALIHLQAVTIKTAADLDSKAMANIVAQNLMADIQSDPQPPSLGEAQGQVENGGRNWRWARQVERADDERLLQVTVRVEGNDGASPAVLSFLHEAQAVQP